METIKKNLDALLAFHSVAASGSFTAAANHLGLSKSMISKQVRRLEMYLGLPLFKRTTRALGMTEEGKLLFDYSQKIMALSVEAERTLLDLNQKEKGQMRISAPVGLGPIFFSSFLAEISKVLPEVKFTSDISNEVRDLIVDDIDFAIRATDDHHPELVARCLGHVRDVVCVTPKSMKKLKLGDDPRELKNVECILYANQPHWNVWTMTSGLDEVQVHVDGRYTTNTYAGALSLCLGDLGVCRLPSYVADEALIQGKLVQLFPRYQMTTHPLYLVYIKRSQESKKHQAVKKGILEWFKDRPTLLVKLAK